VTELAGDERDRRAHVVREKATHRSMKCLGRGLISTSNLLE